MSEALEKTESAAPAERGSLLHILGIFLRLGCTSFGGPIAHIGYFRHEFVERRKWLDERAYADVVALCNFLPGPASSQVGIALGILRGGVAGGLMAWIGFTLPSAIAMIAFAYGFSALGFSADGEWLHGLKVAAVAVIAQAIWGMGKALCPDRARATLALAATLAMLAWPTAWAQLAVIAFGALIGWIWLPSEAAQTSEVLEFRLSRRMGFFAWTLLLALLVLLPLGVQIFQSQTLAVFDKFYRVGSLVFGGGHVILPLLRNEVVVPGWVSDDVFLAGYGAAQALPGPLFTFSAYLGTVMSAGPGGVAGGLLALGGIFLPSMLLVVGALPYWETLRRKPVAQSALKGVNAVVVGLLLAAFYNPVWTSSIRSNADLALALVAFGLLVFWKISPFYVVLFTAAGGALLALGLSG